MKTLTNPCKSKISLFWAFSNYCEINKEWNINVGELLSFDIVKILLAALPAWPD
jgi:hypothetical protein